MLFQALIFHSSVPNRCSATFPPVWGARAYVTWFSLSNFFLPLVVLIYCYGRICHAIWDNFNSKTNRGRSWRTGEQQSLGQRLRKFWRAISGADKTGTTRR